MEGKIQDQIKGGVENPEGQTQGASHGISSSCLPDLKRGHWVEAIPYKEISQSKLEENEPGVLLPLFPL